MVVFTIQAFLFNKIKLPTSYRLSKQDDNTSHIRYLENETKEMVTYQIYVPLKHDYAVSDLSRGRSGFVSQSLSIFPTFEKLLHILHTIQLETSTLDYTSQGEQSIRIIALKSILKDCQLLLPLFEDIKIENLEHPTLGKIPISVDSFNFPTSLNTYILDLNNTIQQEEEEQLSSLVSQVHI